MFVVDWCGVKITFLWECMGMRSVIALFAIAAFLAFGQRRTICRIGLFGFAVLYAVVGNALRIGSILAFCPISRSFALGAWHDFSGYLFFVCEVLMLAKTADIMKEDHGGNTAK
jgi:exosortase/archaeosortase family protein